MGRSISCTRLRTCIFLLYFTIPSILYTHCDAERSMQLLKGSKHRKRLITKSSNKLRMIKHFDFDTSLESSNGESYGVSSPFSLPPFDSLAPISLPEITPPYCLYPPNTPQSPSTIIPTPIGYTASSPPPPFYYIPPILPIQSPTQSNPPITFPSPFSNIPGSPNPILSPPVYVPGPPGSTLSPPSFEPSPPTAFVPSPGVFLPPIVYPPPNVPPPPNTAPIATLWCVAKPSVPDPIIEEAMNYACGSGADCNSIQPDGSCFQPNTLFAHASYAFNSYWQRTKVAGGTCDFGGTAMLVSVDPSYDGCQFTYN
ncbi:Glucan endo-1,3-beta-glucosidase-like protein 3 [Quillaja saponaria]|uniref:Glucan endo-1,3-beta-glucosidase-like protein 3 n=1 Tax=Quillaja saponaria TaxID=32244 RepID=A0AAD7QIE3_QUISA|nr:Glucan endo-1,3-beta-glucosidase-like protein 3 [Quillaja saponaria]